MRCVEVIGEQLYQWDTDRFVRVVEEFDCSIDEIHFSTSLVETALVVAPIYVEGEIHIPIPNVLLQHGEPICVCIVTFTDNGKHTETHCMLSVTPKVKPDDYVYTETEVRNYQALEKRLEEIESRDADAIAKAVEDYLTTHELKITVDSELDKDSDNPIMNKVVAKELTELENTIGNIDVLLETI